MLQLLRDEDVIAAARDEAQNLLARDPDLDDHLALKAELDALAAGERAEYLERPDFPPANAADAILRSLRGGPLSARPGTRCCPAPGCDGRRCGRAVAGPGWAEP